MGFDDSLEHIVGPKPKISVLSAIYNEEQHLQEMIDSVKGQSYENWELILVDDDSTDSTVEIANKAASGDTRILVRSGYGKLNKVGAFNKAFEVSSGKYIVLLGGDDMLPVDSLAVRIAAVSDELPQSVCGYFRLRTMSDDPRHNGMVVPKKKSGNRSGGTLIMSRVLAENMFPIPNQFVAEDIWLAEMVKIHADAIVEHHDIVLNYRIHAGNSNPRNRPFSVMNESMHRRAAPIEYILNQEVRIDQAKKIELEGLIELERFRYQGKTGRILFQRRGTLIQKLRALSMASEPLYAIRSRFYKLFSGWM